MGIQRAFCSMSFLDDIVKQRKKSESHKIAYALLRKLCDIYVDIPRQDFVKLCESNDVFKILLKRENRSIKSYTDQKKQISEAKADDLFFFSGIDKKESSKAKASRGLFLATQSDMYIFERVSYAQYRPFNLVPQNLRKGDYVEFEPLNSWQEVFDKVDITPINAAVITDNFMFTEKFSERKNQSLYALLRNIVPSTLDIPFHLTIFFNNNNGKLSKEDAQQIVNEIHDLSLCEQIYVSIVAHLVKNTTHDRELLTNYHYMNSGTGFSIIDDRGIREVAKGEIKSVFHCVASMPAQTTVKHLHSQTIEWLRQIYKGDRGTTSSFAYIVGDEFENRLLSD